MNCAWSRLAYPSLTLRKRFALSARQLSAILNGKAGISPEVALRLSIAFMGSPESWLVQQSQYELWQAGQHRSELRVKKLVAA